MNHASGLTSVAVAPPGKGARLRWIICGLLFAAVVLSYIDRLVLSVLKPTLQQLYGWSEGGYGDVVFWFQAAYGLGFLFFGRLIDRIGAKAGYLVAMGVWTAAHMAHALFTSTRGFGTSIPTWGLPGMRSIRIDSAFSAKQRSSTRETTREYLTPGSGLNSYVVTTGPGQMCLICPVTLNSLHFSARRVASPSNSSSACSLCGGCGLRKPTSGSL